MASVAAFSYRMDVRTCSSVSHDSGALTPDNLKPAALTTLNLLGLTKIGENATEPLLAGSKVTVCGLRWL